MTIERQLHDDERSKPCCNQRLRTWGSTEMNVDSTRQRRGQAIVIVALIATLLFGLAAFALDLSLAMSERRKLQADADAAALAGAVSYATSTNAAHWVALQYLQRPLGFTLPLGSCTSISACAAGTYTTGSYTVTLGDPSAKQMDLSIQRTIPGIFASLIGATITTGSSVRTMAPGPTVIPSLYAAAAITGDLSVNGGGTSSPSGNVGGAVYAHGNFGANNGPHASKVPGVAENYDGTTCPGSPTNHIDLGGASDSLQYTWLNSTGTLNTNVSATLQYETSGPTTSGPTYLSTNQAAAKDGLGNWKPGIYSGFAPNGGKMNAGVYKIISYSGTISPGTNTTWTASGTEDTSGAVAIMLDNTDTGGLDLSATVLNGLDDLHSQSYTGPRDPQGTHNFVFWSTNGASGYSGSISVGSTDVSGITYLPKVALSSSGNSSFKFTGATILASASVSGGGNGSQEFLWVCGLAAVLGNAALQGGINR